MKTNTKCNLKTHKQSLYSALGNGNSSSNISSFLSLVCRAFSRRIAYGCDGGGLSPPRLQTRYHHLPTLSSIHTFHQYNMFFTIQTNIILFSERKYHQSRFYKIPNVLSSTSQTSQSRTQQKIDEHECKHKHEEGAIRVCKPYIKPTTCYISIKNHDFQSHNFIIIVLCFSIFKLSTSSSIKTNQLQATLYLCFIYVGKSQNTDS